MANTQGFNPLFWHDDDLLLLEDIANSHSLLPDLPSQESHAAQPATSSSGAPSLARPSSPIIPDAPVQQRAASTAAVQRLQKMNRGYQKRYKEKQKVRPVHLPSLKQLNITPLLDLGKWRCIGLLQWSANGLQARQQNLEAELAETKAKLAESQAALRHFQLISASTNNQNAQHADHAMQTSSHAPSIIHVAWKVS